MRGPDRRIGESGLEAVRAVAVESPGAAGPRGEREALQYLTPTGDFAGQPYGPADPARFDTYRVDGPGLISNRHVQGAQRYQMIRLTTPGIVRLEDVEIHYEGYLGTPSTFRGNFVSSSPLLNQVWYDGAYTLNLTQVRPGTTAGNWVVRDGALSTEGGRVGLHRGGTDWTDYTTAFRARVDFRQAGWVVRAASPTSSYLLILKEDQDALQQVVETAGRYHVIGTTKTPFPIEAGRWYEIATTVSGDLVSTTVDGQPVASFDASRLPAGVPRHASGTIGFREAGNDAASFADLRVTTPEGRTLVDNPLAQPRDLNAFEVPGVVTVPTIVDGGKRDRGVWMDLDVSDETVFYSSYANEYPRESLRLLGSYQMESGWVPGEQSPSLPINTRGRQPGETGEYSASYSMLYVTNLADYLRYTGDVAFARDQWDTVRRQLAWNATQVGPDGLFQTSALTGKGWLYPELHVGAHTAYNVEYHRALTGGAEIADAVGDRAYATHYRQRAAALRDAIDAQLWNEQLGAYDAGTNERGFVVQDANALAVMSGVAPPERRARIVATMSSALATPFGSKRVSSPTPAGYVQLISSFVGTYETKARFEVGDDRGAMDLLTKLWGRMATSDPGSTTWQRMTLDGTLGSGQTSAAHAWGSGATSTLSGYVLGVRPVSPGYADWTVQPHPSGLTWAQGRVPTPRGPIDVKWGRRDRDDSFAMRVTAPGWTRGTIAMPTDGVPVRLWVNGRLAWDRDRGRAYDAHLEGDRVVLSVRGGEYLLQTGR